MSMNQAYTGQLYFLYHLWSKFSHYILWFDENSPWSTEALTLTTYPVFMPFSRVPTNGNVFSHSTSALKNNSKQDDCQ